MYTEAIEFNPNSAVLYANRSFAHLRTESFGYALEDASKAISLDKTYVKGYYRRAAAYMALGKCKLALKDYESVYKARPNDRDAKLKFNECSKIVRQQAFEKAISVDSVKKLVSESINIDTIAVEDSYDGPHLDANGKVTLQFMEELMQRYKNQKKLHKKYACKVRSSPTLTCTVTFIQLFLSIQILLDVMELFKSQPSMVDVIIPEGSKFTVCGDIHGQFYDLMNIFHLNGLPSPTNPFVMSCHFRNSFSFSLVSFPIAFQRRLCGPRLIFCRVHLHTVWIQAAIPRTLLHGSWQP